MAAESKPQAAAANGNKPVMTFRAKGVKVSIWENIATNVEHERKFYKTAIQRVYKEGEAFKTTNSLSRDDLPVARLLLQRAWAWILETESGRNGEEQEIPT
jgi:hypothetical protein